MSDISDAFIASETTVVCPGPSIADSFREMTEGKFPTITVAKWISEVNLAPSQKKVDKAELLVRLGSAFSQYFPDENYHLFLNSFEFFTELRSFSLNLDLLSDVLLNIDEKIKKVVQLFWAVLDSMQLVDEHLLYQMMGNLNSSINLAFIGFKFLSGVQIDMLKNKANYCDVTFFIPKFVKENCLSSDWINWLDPVVLQKNLSNNLEKKKLNIIQYSQGQLNLKLNEILKNEKKINIVKLGSSGELNEIQEIAVSDLLFKSPVDLFEHKREEIFEKIKPSSFLELEVELSDFRKKLIKEKDFLGLKIIELITEVCVLYRELCEKCDNFFVSLMKQVVTLNTPRNFYIPITTTDSKFLTFDELKFNKSNFKTILILSKKNSPFSVSEGGNNELVIQFLNSIGPTKRKGLEVLYLKYELKDFLNTKEHVLLVEDEIVESDSGFRDLKSKFDINEIGLKKSPVNKVAVDVLQELIVVNELEKSKGLFSASRLQAYLDCPRKFYFTYIKKIDESPPVRMVVDAREMGKLEHDIIENYFQENSKIEEEKILELSKLKLNEYIKCSNTKIDQAIYFEVLFELVEFSKNGLSYLYELRNKYQSAKFKFEVKLPENALGITGYIDCLVEKSDGNIILDFKRSSSSVGSITELDEFQKLQLWIYYLVMNNVSNIDYVAYVNISEPERSLIYKDSLELKKDMFESFLNELIFKYQKENKYLPIPLKESVCTYCPINQVCSKGVF